MNISILCSSKSHPINIFLLKWIEKNKENHNISLVRKKKELEAGDVLFLISCHEIIRKEDRIKFKSTLVIHASDLPKGRGWNPHIWSILEGENTIVVTLLEAEDKVDSGKIWKKEQIEILKSDLYDEINKKLFEAELKLMTYAIDNFHRVEPVAQSEVKHLNYYRLRNPEDSKVDPNKSIKEQFNLLRVCDPQRFPSYFELHGSVYKLTIEKLNEKECQDK